MSSRRVWLLLLLALGLVGAAWLVAIAGQLRIARLDLSAFEPIDGHWDVYDCLRRDGYVSRYFLPYLAAAFALDVLAFAGVIAAHTFAHARYAAGRGPMPWQFAPALGAVGLLVLGSSGWHALGLLVNAVFAS